MLARGGTGVRSGTRGALALLFAALWPCCAAAVDSSRLVPQGVFVRDMQWRDWRSRWSPRADHASAALSNGEVVLMGGRAGSQVVKGDVWLSSDGGVTWAQVGFKGRWTPRYAFAISTLPGDEILITGGWGGGLLPPLNDAVRSSDGGATWTQATANASWPGRGAHSSSALPNGDIVLLGGQTYSVCFNDVWRSSDAGATWALVTPHAPWRTRSSHASVVLPSGDLVLLGGWGEDDGGLRDVWRSPDGGLTWTQSTASAPWGGRLSHAAHAFANGDIVLMGGLGDLSTFRHDVWRSSDGGATWAQLWVAAPWSARSGHTLAALPTGHLLLLGGGGSAGSRLNDVWRSPDGGSTWTHVPTNAPWPARTRHVSKVLPSGQMALFGGWDGVRYWNDVWRSSDGGTTWTQVVAAAPWKGRSACAGVLPTGDLVLMGGWDGAHYLNDVWRSSDGGATWTALTAHAPWSARSGCSCSELPDADLVLIGGWTGVWDGNDVWRSWDGGASWVRVIAEAPWAARHEHASAVLPGGVVVIMGGMTRSGYQNDVWRSPDAGAEWACVADDAPWPMRMSHSSVALPSGDLLLVGGMKAQGKLNDVWRSSDGGATWIAAPSDGPWSPRLAHTTVVLPSGDIVLAGGWDDATGGLNDVWRSSDGGVTWAAAQPEQAACAPSSNATGQCHRTLAWKQVRASPVENSDDAAIAVTAGDRLVQVSFPCGPGSVRLLPLLNPAPADSAWVQLGDAVLPEGLSDSATAPFARAAEGPGMLVCGGRTAGSAPLSACWWIGAPGMLRLCGASAAGDDEAPCSWPPRYGGVLASAQYPPLADVALLFGGKDRYGSILSDLWLSASLGETWHAIAATLPRVFRPAVGFLAEDSTGEAPCARDPWSTAYRVLIAGGIDRSFLASNVSRVLDVCLNHVNGSAWVAAHSVYTSPLVRAFGAVSINLPNMLFCTLGGQTSYAAAPEARATRCTQDGREWRELSVLPATVSFRPGAGVAFFPRTQQLVVMGGPAGLFHSLQLDAVVRLDLPADGDARVHWSTSMLARSPTASGARLYCAVSNETLRHFALHNAGTGVRLAAPLERRLGCPRALVQACVDSATWNGPLCSAPVPARVLGTASPGQVILGRQVDIAVRTTLPKALEPHTLAAVTVAANATALQPVPAALARWSHIGRYSDTITVSPPAQALTPGEWFVFRIVLLHGGGVVGVATSAPVVAQCPAQRTAVPIPACPQCPAGTFRIAGSERCEKCPEHSTTVEPAVGTSLRDCVCSAGHVEVLRSAERLACDRCDAGLQCTTPNLNEQNVTARPGFWRSAAHQLRADRCVAMPKACSGISRPARACAAGHTGMLCAECAPGYAFGSISVNARCVPCTRSATAMAWTVLGAFLLTAAFVAWLFLTLDGRLWLYSIRPAVHLWRWKRSASSRAELHSAELSGLSHALLDSRGSPSSSSLEPTASGPIGTATRSSARCSCCRPALRSVRLAVAAVGVAWIKPTLLFLQLVGICRGYASAVSPVIGQNADKLSAAMEVLSRFDVRPVASLGCAWHEWDSVAATLVASTALPLIAMAACYLLGRRRRRQDDAAGASRRWLAACWIFVLFSANAQQTALSMFACTYLHADGLDHLIRAPSVICWSSREHAVLLAWGGCMWATYALGLPFVLLSALRRAASKADGQGGCVWLEPVRTGMHNDAWALELLEPLQRSVTIALFVFLPSRWARAVTDSGGLPVPSAALPALAALVLQLVHFLVVIHRRPFLTARAHALFVALRVLMLLSMVQLCMATLVAGTELASPSAGRNGDPLIHAPLSVLVIASPAVFALVATASGGEA